MEETNVCQKIQRLLRYGKASAKNLVELTTTVKYKNGKTLIYNNSTVSLEDIKEEDFEVITRARYNKTIVAGTSCTQVEKKVEGTMVTLYETNPNATNSLNSNYMLLINMILLSTAIETFTYSRGQKIYANHVVDSTLKTTFEFGNILLFKYNS